MPRLVLALLIVTGCVFGAETEDAQRAKADARKAAQRAWLEKTLLDGYEKIGRRDPKWDDQARVALRQVVNWCARDPRFQYNEEVALDLCEKAVAAGCDDPIILLHRQHLLYALKHEKYSADAHADIVEAVAASGYAPYMKFFALIRGAEWTLGAKDQESRDIAGAFLERAFALVPELARDPNTPADSFMKLCYWWVNSAAKLGKVRREALERMCVALLKESPGKTLPYVLKAKVYQGNATKAESDADKREWATQAEKELIEALKIDPADPTALAEMISVCAWLHRPRETMEQWFKRAMDADPDNYRACILKTFYLDPKQSQSGSKEAMVAFGRECVKSGNWIGQIPYMLIDIHNDLASRGDEAAYYKDPEVWKDIESVYEEWLKRYPDAAYEHASYARLAALSEHWDIAEREFKKVGEYPLLRSYKDRAEYDRLRKLAAEHAGK